MGEFSQVKAGDVVYAYVDQGNPRVYFEPLRVVRVTDTQIITESGDRFKRDGGGIGDARYRFLTSEEHALLIRYKMAVDAAAKHLAPNEMREMCRRYEEIARRHGVVIPDYKDATHTL